MSPELLILLRNCPVGISLDYVGWGWLMGWGWLLLMHSLAYRYDVLPERCPSSVMAAFIVGLLLIMFGLPVFAWLAGGWFGGVVIWYRLFVRYS